MILRLTWARLDKACDETAATRCVVKVDDRSQARKVRQVYRLMRAAGIERRIAVSYVNALLCSSSTITVERREVTE